MSKPIKLTQKQSTKSEKLTKSEEQLIINPEVWINMEKKTSSEDEALEKEAWIKKCKSENWLYKTLGRLKKKKTSLIAATFVQATTSLVTSSLTSDFTRRARLKKEKRLF